MIFTQKMSESRMRGNMKISKRLVCEPPYAGGGAPYAGGGAPYAGGGAPYP
jgi:hypothetical protein